MTDNEIFNQLELPNGFDCEGCEHLLTTPDVFGTGDSPTHLECEIQDIARCPAVMKEKKIINENLAFEREMAC